MPAPMENDSDEASLPTPSGRCADLVLESGEVVIYDADNHRAWIQSDGAVEVTALA